MHARTLFRRGRLPWTPRSACQIMSGRATAQGRNAQTAQSYDIGPMHALDKRATAINVANGMYVVATNNTNDISANA